jgi:translation initiation factor IF-1
MPKEEEITVKGTVVAQERNYFIVEIPEILDTATCTIGGKLRKHNITITIGDTVGVTLSPYDLNRGRITTRL